MQIDYRTILSEIHEERKSLNSAYSLRAFARDLKISPSTLSEILNSKKGLSPKLATSIARNLKLPDWEVRYFCDLVTKHHAKSARDRKAAAMRLQTKSRDNHVRLLSHKTTKALTSWIDVAILELTHIKDFKPCHLWIAKIINVDESKVQASIERLLEAKLLEKNAKTGKWIDVSPLFSTTDGIPNESIRHFHKTILNLALQKIDNTNTESRTVKSVVFSVSKANVPKAKKILDEAINQILALADESKQKREDVMCFSSQLFSLLHSTKDQ